MCEKHDWLPPALTDQGLEKPATYVHALDQNKTWDATSPQADALSTRALQRLLKTCQVFYLATRNCHENV